MTPLSIFREKVEQKHSRKHSDTEEKRKHFHGNKSNMDDCCCCCDHLDKMKIAKKNKRARAEFVPAWSRRAYSTCSALDPLQQKGGLLFSNRTAQSSAASAVKDRRTSKSAADASFSSTVFC